MQMYEARPGLWLCVGVTIEEHERAVASNWGPENDVGLEDYPEFLTDYYDRRKIWITKDGEDIAYDRLMDDHLKNIINMLTRYKKLYLYPNLAKEQERRAKNAKKESRRSKTSRDGRKVQGNR